MCCDAPFVRGSSLWERFNVTSAAGQFPGPAAAVCSGTTASTSEFFGLDFLLMILGELWARVSRELVHFYAMTMQSERMDLCNDQHPLEGQQRSVISKSTTSITTISGLIYILVILGLLAAVFSPWRTRLTGILKPHCLDGGYAQARKKGRVYYYVTKAQIQSVFASLAGICYYISNVNREKITYNMNLSNNFMMRPAQMVILFILLNINSVQSTCMTCRGAVDGCAGGSTCPWLTTVASNAAAVVATATMPPPNLS